MLSTALFSTSYPQIYPQLIHRTGKGDVSMGYRFNSRAELRAEAQRSAHYVVPVFICLISLLIAVGAHAQTATTDANDSKRVQILQIQEASATNESSVKKSKSAAKKKVVRRKNYGQTKAAANEGAPNPNTPIQYAMAAVAPGTPAQNDTLMLSTEQTGTLAVGDRAVAFASSPGVDNIAGVSVANFMGTREDPSASSLANGIPPRSIADAERAPATQTAGRQVPSSRNSPLSQSLAILSGAMLAVVFGWYLVGSSRRRISVGVGT